MNVAAGYQPVFREIGLDAEAVFDHPLITAWRRLPDRENCTFDATLSDGRTLRWHIKRYARPRKPSVIPAAENDVRGHRLLVERQVPTATLIAWDSLADGRSFVIFEDLVGYEPADKLIERGGADAFAALLKPTADLAARLHQANLHHRDLYLCHFMAKLARVEASAPPDVRLIDSARVRPLPGLLTRNRWIVKDLAQFWYSTLRLPIDDVMRDAWLSRYAAERGMPSAAPLRPSILRKVRRIARHDARLNRQRPTRNVSIPRLPSSTP
jgi:hypothetical protein